MGRSPDTHSEGYEQSKNRDLSYDQQYHAPGPSNPWRTGFWRRLPWLASLALMITIFAAVVMVVVLRLSDGQEVARWKVSPAVYLSVASTISNVLLVFALDRATEIAFWVKALKPRTTVKDLHEVWAFGTSLKEALLSGRSFNLVALAGIAVALSPINGSLLQRASTVSTHFVTTPVSLKIPAAQELPYGYTGTISGRSHQVSFANGNFSAVVKDYNDGRAFNLTSWSGCSGSCTGTMRAAGYKINCVPSTIPFNVNRSLLLNNDDSVYDSHTIFASNFTYLEDYQPGTSRIPIEMLNYTSLFKTTDACQGDVHVQQCSLLPALLEYHVLLQNNTIGLDPAFSYKDDKVIKMTPALGSEGQGGSTHGGMGLVLNAMFSSEASISFNGAVGYSLVTNGVPSFQYSSSTFNPQECSVKWSDPTNDMLGTARNLIFRTALRAANVSNATDFQAFRAVERNTLTVYQSHYLYLALALFFTLFSTLCVAPTFLGFWRLGRSVTLSPIEVAKAFNTAILRSSDSNLPVERLLDEVGGHGIRYGSALEGPEKLIMSEPGLVTAPVDGKLFRG